MPKSLDKTRKKIAKKRNGTIDALHKFSRDSKRLHRAQIRDERLIKVASTRRKQDRPLHERVQFFQTAVQENDIKALDEVAIRVKINEYIHRYDEEYTAVKKERRPGRPATPREDLLKVTIDALEKENQNGFLLPDLSSQENVERFERWDGAWAHLTNLQWVRITPDGSTKPAVFPPKG